MRLLSLISLSLLVNLFHSETSQALTFTKKQLICPIDGEQFSQQLVASGYTAGTMLDLMPYGATAAPWPLPVCPTTGFVIYQKEFGATELDKLRQFVQSEEWSKLRTETPYYRAVMTKIWMGDKPDEYAFMLLKATWEATNREQYLRYANKALDTYRALLNGTPKDLSSAEDADWMDQELIAGELERRLEMFSDAKERFERLQTMPAFKQNYREKIVALQLQLIKDQDSRTHMAP